DVDQLAELADQVVDVHPRAAVDVGGKLSGQDRGAHTRESSGPAATRPGGAHSGHRDQLRACGTGVTGDAELSLVRPVDPRTVGRSGPMRERRRCGLWSQPWRAS